MWMNPLPTHGMPVIDVTVKISHTNRAQSKFLLLLKLSCNYLHSTRRVVIAYFKREFAVHFKSKILPCRLACNRIP